MKSARLGLTILMGCLLGWAVTIQPARAQPFTITSSGEMDLDSDTVVVDGVVKKYFGMYVTGLGESKLRVSIGNQSMEKSYTFRVDPTRLVSYLFDGDLADDVDIAFRRGVFGSVLVQVLDTSGTVQASTTITLDVTLKKRNCAKHPSSKLKRCARVDLSKATARQRRLLAQKFVRSIRGPIVLEP